MEKIREELTAMLNKALTLEHAARIQYLAHAEQVQGLDSEQVIDRLKELASDEEKHEGVFRKLLGDYMKSAPTMEVGLTHKAGNMGEILTVNLGNEKEAIDFYKQLYKKVTENKEALQYEFETLEHGIRHIIIDEQEHVTELERLMEKSSGRKTKTGEYLHA